MTNDGLGNHKGLHGKNMTALKMQKKVSVRKSCRRNEIKNVNYKLSGEMLCTCCYLIRDLSSLDKKTIIIVSPTVEMK